MVLSQPLSYIYGGEGRVGTYRRTKLRLKACPCIFSLDAAAAGAAFGLGAVGL